MAPTREPAGVPAPRSWDDSRPPIAGVGRGDGPTAVADAVAGAADGLSDGPPSLLLVYCDATLEPDAVAAEAAAAAPGARVAGLTMEGAITHEGLCVGSCVAVAFSGAVAAGVGVAPDASSDMRAAGRAAAAAALSGLDLRPGHGVLLLFLDPRSGDQADAIDGAYAVAGARIPLAGGGANGPDPRLIGDGHAHRDAVVAVALDSPAPVSVGIADGCRPWGRPAIATWTDGRSVRELNGRPAEEVYLEELGHAGAQLPDDEFEALAVLHPLGQPELRGQVRLRHVIGRAPGGGLACATPIPPNSAVMFTRQTPASIVRSAAQAVRGALGGLDAPARAALIFDCAARKRAVGPELAAEARSLVDALGGTPAVAGIYTRGEVGRLRGAKGDRNHAVVVVGFG